MYYSFPISPYTPILKLDFYTCAGCQPRPEKQARLVGGGGDRPVSTTDIPSRMTPQSLRERSPVLGPEAVGCSRGQQDVGLEWG